MATIFCELSDHPSYIQLKWRFLSMSRFVIRSMVNLDSKSTKTDHTGVLSKVNNAIIDSFFKLFFTVAQLEGHSVEGQGHIQS